MNLIRRHNYRAGFTIVELLIVIVVIGILATIAFLAYNGVSRQATVALLQTDLESAAKQLKYDQVEAIGYPATMAAANGGAGLKASKGTTYQYTVDNSVSPQTFCLTATNGTVVYYINQGGTPQPGVCSGHTDASIVSNGDTVTAFAGSGTLTCGDGSTTTASIAPPSAMVINAAGTVMYVTDRGCHDIRAITLPGGVVTTYAGSAYSSGVSNGTGTSLTGVTFTNPDDIAIDSSDNLYIADYYRIRKIITSTGATSTLAGANTGYVDATGTSARFAGITQIAIAPSGDLYVADPNNNRIRKVTSTGVTTTFAGSTSGYLDATGTSAQFNTPMGIAINSTGDIYVADSYNNRIRKITPAGVVTTFAGSTSGTTDATGTSAKFYSPSYLRFDSSNNLYVSDRDNNRIRKITPAGVVTTLAGSTSGYVNDVGTAAKFNRPGGLWITSSGILYVADTNNNRIRMIQ